MADPQLVTDTVRQISGHCDLSTETQDVGSLCNSCESSQSTGIISNGPPGAVHQILEHTHSLTGSDRRMGIVIMTFYRVLAANATPDRFSRSASLPAARVPFICRNVRVAVTEGHQEQNIIESRKRIPTSWDRILQSAMILELGRHGEPRSEDGK